MKLFTWIFLIICVVIAGLYTYNYFNMPRLDNLTTINNCISSDEKDNYGLFKRNNYEIYLPKDWPFMELSVGAIPGNYNFGINKEDPYEFISIRQIDYNKSTDDLILETLKPLTNYTILDQSTFTTQNKEIMKKVIIKFNDPSNKYVQEIYSYTKNNSGYLIYVIISSQNKRDFENIYLNKILCSFKVN